MSVYVGFIFGNYIQSFVKGLKTTSLQLMVHGNQQMIALSAITDKQVAHIPVDDLHPKIPIIPHVKINI